MVHTLTPPRPHLLRASESFDADAARRARLLAGLAPWADARPQYRLRLGPTALPFTALSDDALCDLRARIAGDVRRERSRRRG